MPFFEKQKPYMAYWVKPSFGVIEFTKTGKLKGYAVGVHKPRKIDRIPNEAMRIEELRPKLSIIVMDGKIEALPFPASESPRFMASICALSLDQNLYSQSILLAHRVFEVARSRHRTNYATYDVESFREQTFLKNATICSSTFASLGKYHYVDPKLRPNDIQWVKNSVIYFVRNDINYKTGEIEYRIDQLLAIGLDVRYSLPVLGFKKSWGNYTTIIPLIDRGLQIITAMNHIVYHRNTRFLPINQFEEAFEQHMTKMTNFELVQVDFMRSDFSTLLTFLSSENYVSTNQ